MKQLKTLQAGRAIAAICVAIFHLSSNMGKERYGGVQLFWDYARYGNLGVDFFFVLSGFIILFAHVNDIGKPDRWLRYVERRFVRLYPIYWLCLLVFTVVLLTFGGAEANVPDNFADWMTTVTLIRFTDVLTPLTVAWTLFHELAFYAVFSLLILNRRLGVTALILVVLMSVLLYRIPAPDFKASDVYTSAYNLYFVFGMGAFLLYRRGGSGWIELACGPLLSIVAFFGLRGSPLALQIQPMLFMFGLALTLVGATKAEVRGSLKVPVFLAFIGDASYSIYLTHSHVQGLLMKLAKAIHLPSFIGPKGAYFVELSGSIALGCVAYVLIEKPLLAFLRRSGKVAPAIANEPLKAVS